MSNTRVSKKEEVFLTEQTSKLFDPLDFADTFSTTNHEDSLEEISKRIFTLKSKWIIALFELRNKLVSVFGLKTAIPSDYKEDFVVGGYVGFFKIYAISDEQLILGADDKHLKFRVGIHNTHAVANNIKVTTLVQLNNTFGKIYMAIIAPFHRLIVKRMVGQGYSDAAPSAR
ncbi:DUF2867 domain-containing protein [Lewinella cohaerens]|uniref:DUF2867 domain-containing protein n=1 Tax=Lewinella cohaerens TaxID=70995 RepID=UPI000360E720|nr:DUF2867 domain-containing protein [Lewinella cohaerens]